MQLKLAGIPVPLWWKILAKNLVVNLKKQLITEHIIINLVDPENSAMTTLFQRKY